MSDIPSKMMKAAVLHGVNDVRLEDIPVPEPGLGDILVSVRVALTCGTDAKVMRRGGHPTMIKPPAPFGHEFSGVVASVGKGVTKFWPGDRVAAANSAPCGVCRYCKLGRQSLCDDILYINGAYAQYILVPARLARVNLLKIPNGLPFEHAALVEPLACVLHGVEESKIRPGDAVVINGAGPIGLLFVRLCSLIGARVLSVDLKPERLEMARKLGAEETVDASAGDAIEAVRALTEGGEGADVSIDATGSEKVWEAALRMVRKGGTVNLFGGCAPGTKITVDTKLIHYSELTIKGVYHHTPYYVGRALALLVGGDMMIEEFITDRMPLAKISDALDRIIRGEGIKTAILPDVC